MMIWHDGDPRVSGQPPGVGEAAIATPDAHSTDCRRLPQGVLYDKRTQPELGQLLEQLSGAAGELDAVQAAVVRDALRWGD